VIWFDESRLDDEQALATVDLRLRALAESGARVRREAGAAAEPIAEVVARGSDARPRAVVAAGPDSRLLRAVLEPFCPVPFVAWPHPGLPGWAGSLDLVVVLAPDGADAGAASAAAEAVRRGCRLVAACPPVSLVADHTVGRDATVVPTSSGDRLAVAVVMLSLLDRLALGPATDAELVADALDQVAIACSPHRDLAVNPAKMLAISLADATPIVWGGSVLAARAARRLAETMRRVGGLTAIAGDADQIVPILEATRPRDVFTDPFADGAGTPRPVLVILDDGNQDDVIVEQRQRLVEVADGRGIRVELVTAEASSDVARYASLLLHGTYAAEYLGLGLVDD